VPEMSWRGHVEPIVHLLCRLQRRVHRLPRRNPGHAKGRIARPRSLLRRLSRENLKRADCRTSQSGAVRPRPWPRQPPRQQPLLRSVSLNYLLGRLGLHRHRLH
jgi:hypothetical protein